jgi:hypothetical protein
MTVETQSRLYVDDGSIDGRDRMRVRINVTLPNLRCDYLGLDIQDSLGRHEVGYLGETIKTPLLSAADPEKQGCNFAGEFFIMKVPGNFHIGTHGQQAAYGKMVDVGVLQCSTMLASDLSHVRLLTGHIIHELTLGDDLEEQHVRPRHCSHARTLTAAWRRFPAPAGRSAPSIMSITPVPNRPKTTLTTTSSRLSPPSLSILTARPRL